MCIRDSLLTAEPEFPIEPEHLIAYNCASHDGHRWLSSWFPQKEIGDNLNSVSYTHLDVYKRQEQDVSEYLSGKRRFLIDGGDTSKEYETARSKVLDEMFELKDPQFADVIGNYLLKCCEDSHFADLVLQKHKTLQRCIESLMGKVYDMVSDEVKENNRYAGKAVAGEAVFDWVKAYYVRDEMCIRDRLKRDRAGDTGVCDL